MNKIKGKVATVEGVLRKSHENQKAEHPEGKSLSLMKKLVNGLFLVSAIALIAFSCKKDDPVPVSLIGTWILINEVASGCDDPSDNDSAPCTTGCEEWIFSETSISIGIYSFTYTKSGNTLSLEVDYGDILEITYSISGSTLTLTINDSPSDGCLFVSTFTKKG